MCLADVHVIHSLVLILRRTISPLISNTTTNRARRGLNYALRMHVCQIEGLKPGRRGAVFGPGRPYTFDGPWFVPSTSRFKRVLPFLQAPFSLLIVVMVQSWNTFLVHWNTGGRSVG